MLASTIVAANFLEQDSAVIAVMSVAFFGQGMCNLGWTLISDVAPKQFIGLTAGIFNLCANLAGIVTPLLVGAIVQATGSFEWALAYIAACWPSAAPCRTSSWSAMCAALKSNLRLPQFRASRAGCGRVWPRALRRRPWRIRG